MKKLIIFIIIILVLGVGYYLISPLFRVVEINEEIPENIITSGVENLSQEEQEEFNKIMVEQNQVPPIEMQEAMPVVTTIVQEEDITESAMVIGTQGHPAEGRVKVLSTSSGTVIRYEDFSTINGPRLNVYLAKDLEAKEYYDLGPIKGTKGNINYNVPSGVDISEYKYVMYWCVPFHVLFNYAEIN